MKTKKILYSILLGSSLTLGACTDFLDVSDELASNLTVEQVFDNVSYTKGWHANIYNCISEYSSMYYQITGFDNPWPYLCNELTSAYHYPETEMINGFTANSAHFHRFTDLYKYIRQAYIFLDRVKPIGGSTDANSLLEPEVLRMKSEVKFLIAYSYFSMFELYGPVPIVSGAVDESQISFDFSRPSVDEFLKFVDDLLQEVLDEDYLPHTLRYTDAVTGEEVENMNEMVRPTRAVVLALRAKLWVYAASKLFNGGYPEAMELRNKDGKQLFPAEDRGKWQIAKQHLECFLEFAHKNGYELFRAYNKDKTENPSQSVYQLFQQYNREIIWATSDTYLIDLIDGRSLDRRCTPKDVFKGSAGIGVSQQMVDAFFTDKGLDKDEDPEYNEDGFSDQNNPCAQVQPQIDKNVFNMYVNREPRFYHAITYHGKSWHIQPKKGYTVQMGWGDPNGNQNEDYTHYSGYYLYKRVNHTLLNTGTYPKKYVRPSILLRLADFYLYYAEACNEVDYQDPNVIKYLDLVRERAGIPGYQTLHDNGTKTNVIGNYEAQAYAIRRERQVELFSEGQRYFDVRRWMICGPGEEADQSVEWGMNVTGSSKLPPSDPGSFFRRTIVRKYNWMRAMYLYPIPHEEIQKSPSLVQNPLW